VFGYVNPTATMDTYYVTRGVYVVKLTRC